MKTKKITSNQVQMYWMALVCELQKRGASTETIQTVTEELIINAINQERCVEDVAWAVMQ